MKAIILNEAGNVDNLIYTDIQQPVPGDNDVLVKMKSLSLNPVDVRCRASDDNLLWLFGDQRPVILGWDISGIVVQTGKMVSDFKIGDEVFGMINFPEAGNAYAEYVVALASHLALKPQEVSHQEAAASSLTALTAWQILKSAKIGQGDRVLIHAASGGVGHFAVQIAKHLGAYVIGTSSAANKEFVLSLGADEYIDYREQAFDKILKDIDFVFDTVASDTLTRSLDIVRKGGRVITIPSPSIPQQDIDKAQQLGVNLSFQLVESGGKDMQMIASMLERGILKPNIDKVFSFDEIKEAHIEMEKGRTRGKIVIDL